MTALFCEKKALCRPYKTNTSHNMAAARREYHVPGMWLPDSNVCTFRLDRYLCLKNVHVWFPDAQDPDFTKACLRWATLSLAPTYNIANVPITALEKFQHVPCPHASRELQGSPPPPAFMLSPAEDGSSGCTGRLPLEVLFPQGLMVCQDSDLCLTFHGIPDDCRRIVLVARNPSYVRDAMLSASGMDVVVQTIERKPIDTSQERVRGDVLHTWVHGPLRALYAEGAAHPKCALLESWGLAAPTQTYVLLPVAHPAPADVLVLQQDCCVQTGFMGIKFDKALDDIPVLVCLCEGLLRMRHGVAGLLLAREHLPFPE